MDYSELVKVYRKLEATQSNLEKTSILADMFREADKEAVRRLAKLAMGRVFPAWDTREIGISSKLMLKAISRAISVDESRVEDEWRDTGDLGKAAENLLKSVNQQSIRSVMSGKKKLKVESVHDDLKKMAGFEGSGSQDRKITVISRLVNTAEPEEAKYIIKTVLGNLRVGVGEGTVRDALVEGLFPDIITPSQVKEMELEGKKVLVERSILLPEKDRFESFSFDPDNLSGTEPERYNTVILRKGDGKKMKEALKSAVQHGYDVTNDFGEVAVTIKESGLEGLESLEMELFRPVNAMLAMKVDSLEEGFETVGRPAGIDFKYDGMRAQIHKKGDEVRVFTRRLEDVTEQFPDVREAVERNVSSEGCIIDSEIVAYDPEDGSLIPFQKLSKRIKRKYGIGEMTEEIPVEVRPFDLIYDEGSVIGESYSDRYERLETMVSEDKRSIRMVDHAETSDEEEASAMQQRALSQGHEGIMMKNLDAEYRPGSRVGYMVKLKPVMETLDLVIIGGEWGEGRRSSWVGSLFLGCKSEEGYEEVGKLATGLTDEQLEELTERLKPLIVSEEGREIEVRPEVVVEAEFEEIQQSPTYSSGYALRFPRLKRFRDDKEDADTLEKVERLYKSQN